MTWQQQQLKLQQQQHKHTSKTTFVQSVKWKKEKLVDEVALASE